MSKQKLTQSQMISLWKRIRDYDFEGLVSPSILERISDMFSDVSPHMHAFAHKLSGTSFFLKRKWDKKMAERVINQYKRYCFLAVVCDHPVTPSLAVDECWHTHLMYSRKYLEFCDNVLQFDLHHEPGFDLNEERLQFDEQYLLTLDAYKFHFGEEAPQDIWPHKVVRKRYEEAKNKEYESSYDTTTTDTPFIQTWVDDDHGSIHSADHHDGFGGYSNGNFGGGGGGVEFNEAPATHHDVNVDVTDSVDAGDGGSSCGSGCGGD